MSVMNLNHQFNLGRKLICAICSVSTYENEQDSSKKILMAPFPSNRLICRLWVKAVGNPKLATIPASKLHETQYICALHFRPRDYDRNSSKLRLEAVPSMALSAPPLSDELVKHYLHDGPPKMFAKTSSGNNRATSAAPLVLTDTVCAIADEHDYCAATQAEAPVKTVTVAPVRKLTKVKLSEIIDPISATLKVPNVTKLEPVKVIGPVERPVTISANAAPPPAAPKESSINEKSESSGKNCTVRCCPESKKTTVILPNGKKLEKIILNEILDASQSTVVLPDGKKIEKIYVKNISGGSRQAVTNYTIRCYPGASVKKPSTQTDASNNKSVSKPKPLSPVLPPPAKSPPRLNFDDDDPVEVPHAQTSTPNIQQYANMITTPIPSTMLKQTILSKPLALTTIASLQNDVKDKQTKNNSLAKQNRKLLSTFKKNHIELKSLRKKMRDIDKISSPILKCLLDSATRNSNGKKLNGFRYTNLNKSLALALYKKCPDIYKCLSQVLPLCGHRSLDKAIDKINAEPGVYDFVLSHLKKKGETMSEKDKICVLLFGHLPLKKHLVHNGYTDQIDGYEDIGDEEGRTEKVAEFVLIFMLQSILKDIKQPIAHYFISDTIEVEKFAVILMTVIRTISEAGFKIIGTVCDTGAVNVGALNLLKSFYGLPEESNFILINNEPIYIVYDVPQLFRSLRDHFVEAGILVVDNKKAEWNHLVEMEKKNSESLHFKKITSLHVSRECMLKPGLKLAVEILSNTVAAILKMMAEAKNGEESSSMMQTALVVEDLDRLFDSTNGPASDQDVKKLCRQYVSKHSFHHALWEDYRRKLSTLHFIDAESRYVHANVTCVDGFINTLASLEDIWKYLETKSVRFISLRNLNQDALHEFFEVVKRHSQHTNPTAAQFTQAVKSISLKRLSTPLNSGTTEKECTDLLLEFHDIVFPTKNDRKTKNDTLNQNEPNPDATEGDAQSQNDSQIESMVSDGNVPIFTIAEENGVDLELNKVIENFKIFDKIPIVYLSSYFASVILKMNCETCKLSAQVDNPDPNSNYDYMELRQGWNDESVIYPTIQLCELVDRAISIFEVEIRSRLHWKNISDLCKREIMKNSDFSWLCPTHRNHMANKIMQRLAVILIRNECRIFNAAFAPTEEGRPAGKSNKPKQTVKRVAKKRTRKGKTLSQDDINEFTPDQILQYVERTRLNDNIS